MSTKQTKLTNQQARILINFKAAKRIDRTTAAYWRDVYRHLFPGRDADQDAKRVAA